MPKGYNQMLAEALAMVRSLNVEEARKLVGDPGVVFVDVRDAKELAQSGKIPGAVHVSRGMLEFYADPESPYHMPALDRRKRIVVNCGSGGRSALAARTLKEMGFDDVCTLTGGITAWKEAGAPIEAVQG